MLLPCDASEMYSTPFCPGVRIERQYATHDRTYIAGAKSGCDCHAHGAV
jgi:hypothetical protein